VTDVEQPEDEQRTPPDTDAPAEEPVAAEEASAAEAASDASDAPEPAAEAEAPAAEAEAPAEAPPEEPAAEEPVAEAEQPAAEEQAVAETPTQAPEPAAAAEEELIPETPRVKPEIPGADLVPDIVPEGGDALGETLLQYDEDHEPVTPVSESDEEPYVQPIADAAISLATGARYTATGKRKTAVARVTLKPGKGEYVINGKPLEAFFPRPTLQRNIRQPLETVGYEARMDVVAKLHGGGVSAQAGALRHGISRALLEADPNLRGELKRRGFLTRDARAKERKKAGLKKARKRPQFSKR
jgi:small subunit ribosomal protein S9